MRRIDKQYKFRKKRNLNLTTPCCNSSNKDGKFVNFVGLADHYGYCHSCGKSSKPPTIYLDDNDDEFVYNEHLRKFQPLNNGIGQNLKLSSSTMDTRKITEIPKRFLDESLVWDYYSRLPENNLLTFLRKAYDKKRVDEVCEEYLIGTCEQGGTVFWNINKQLKVQKVKICFYTKDGRRKDYFKVPYKNDDGYYPCLFGEHLLCDDKSHQQIVVLVESPKTAIVGAINIPRYTWLSYEGINGLKEDKMHCLKGFHVLVIPDISNRAVEVMKPKIKTMKDLGVKAKLWDTTYGQSDDELKRAGIYNNDIEDEFREIFNLQN